MGRDGDLNETPAESEGPYHEERSPLPGLPLLAERGEGPGEGRSNSAGARSSRRPLFLTLSPPRGARRLEGVRGAGVLVRRGDSVRG